MTQQPSEQLPWRVGRKVGRTIYTVDPDDPDGDGVLIGVMDTRGLAAEAVLAHNHLLSDQRWNRGG